MSVVQRLSLPRLVTKFMKNQMDSKVVLIEGNIGAGKSTLIQYLKKKCPNESVQSWSEPVDQWRHAHGSNLFELMYKSPARWTFAFQCYTNLTRKSLHDYVNSCDSNANVKIIERSLFSAQYAFVENSYAMNLINDVEYGVLKQWFDYFTKDIQIDHVVYLRSDPEVCLKRINLRSRPEEKDSISLDYLNSIHKFHDKWLIDKDGADKRKNIREVTVIDASQDINELYSTYNYLKDKLLVDNSSSISH